MDRAISGREFIKQKGSEGNSQGFQSARTGKMKRKQVAKNDRGEREGSREGIAPKGTHESRETLRGRDFVDLYGGDATPEYKIGIREQVRQKGKASEETRWKKTGRHSP